MELFNGKREVNINEGETASSISASRVSNKPEKAAQLALDAQSRFGGGQNSKKQDGRSVAFAEPGSPEGREAWRETGSDSKQGIRDIDKILAQNEAQMGIDNEDGLER